MFKLSFREAAGNAAPTTVRKLAGALVVPCVIAGGAVLSAPSAQAATVYASYSATSAVGERLQPVAAPDGNYGMPAGAVLPVECQALGQPVGSNGNTLYLRGSYGGRQLYLPDAYSSSPHLAGQPPISGIPMCGAAASTGLSPAWEIGIVQGFAMSHVGQNYDSELCLTFVFEAYQRAGIDLRSQINVPIGYNTYPADLIGHFTAGTTGTGTPPAGALIFYTSRYGRTYSHVTVSLGGSDSVSTTDSVGYLVHRETTAQHAAATGATMMWWLPAL